MFIVTYFTNIAFFKYIDIIALIAILMGVLYQDVFALLAFLPLLRIDRKLISNGLFYKKIWSLLSLFIISCLSIQAAFGIGYKNVYQEFAFTSFTENPNMISYIVISIYSLEVGINSLTKRSYIGKLRRLIISLLIFYILIKSGSRNAILPYLILLCIDFKIIRKPYLISFRSKILLFFTPLIIPLTFVFLYNFKFIDTEYLNLVQRPDWLNILSLGDGKGSSIGLNSFLYLYSKFGNGLFILFVFSAFILFIEKRTISIAFFAVWLMGTFEAHVVTFAYGAPIVLFILLNINSFHTIKNENFKKA